MSAYPPLRIHIAGGGPTGLTFALALAAYGVDARIRIFDPRWHRSGGSIEWREIEHGNRRRRQIVTLQSNVWHELPHPVQQALFDRQDYAEVWPCSPDSPPHRGPPRNLPIRDIEDRLLDRLRATPGVELVPERYDPDDVADAELLAICEGAHSATREHFLPQFGRPHAELYQLNGRVLEETLLGMQVQTDTPPGQAVLLTAMQNRYLLNTHRQTGFLNMRLSHDEAAGLPGLGQTADATLPTGAVRSSRLWPAISQGLRLFGIDEHGVRNIRAFRCSLVHRPRFVAEVAPGTWGCLLGDAANALHFWPGRGLNTGMKSALSLARCLVRQWRGAGLRAADLVEHEGVMHMLQAREVGNRTWQTMLMNDAHGAPLPIDQRIRRGLQGPCDRSSLTRELLLRLQRMRKRLEGRTPALPDDRWLAARLASLDERTLKVLVETGPWVSAEVGGPEVDVAALLPLPARHGAPPVAAAAAPGRGPAAWALAAAA